MSQENVEVVRRWWGGFNDDGMPPLSLCDEQIEIRMPPDFPVRGLFQGHEGVRRWREQVFEVAENARVEPEEIVDVHGDGETVLMLLRATGTASYSEIEIKIEWAAIWTIRAGKVLRAQGYLNCADAIAAPVARGREEGLDDLSLSVQVGVGDGVLSPHAAAGAARQLAGRLGGTVDDRRDVVEGHREDVVEHERESLGGAQRIEHHEQRETDGVSE